MTRVALVQIASPDSESRDERVGRVEALLDAQRGENVDLFVLPELWAAGYFSFERYGELAEDFNGATISMCRRAARRLGAWVHAGSIVERDAAGLLHNTSVLIDAEGNIAQTYRKIHVFGYESLETQLLSPGDSLEVADSPLGPLASTTCYDLRFPGLWLEVSARGAEVAVVPAAWPAARREHFQLFTRVRAVEHQLWMIAVNACGSQAGVELGGCSRIVDPGGNVVVECSASDEQVEIADLDPATVSRVREEFPVIADRLAPGDYPALG